MITKEILESHSVTVLKKELSKTNIKGYSKMKKSEVVSLMLKPEHSKRFSHIVKKGEQPKPEKKIVIKRTPKPEKKIIIKRTPKPEKKIIIKRTPKPEKKIVIKRTPKPEKKIVIKRTPKPAAPKPEKKIVIKKPRRETPGSVEAKRIKKKIEIKKGSTLKTKCEKAEEQAGKLYFFLKDLDEYDDEKGLQSKKIQDQFPKWEKIYKEDIFPLIQYIKGRGDATECEKIMGEGYEENLRNIQSYWNRYKRTNESYNYKLEEEAKKKARREEKKKGKAPAPAKKRMLSPLEDIRAYLNNVNSKEYKMLRAGKEPKSGEKDWYQVLQEKLIKVMDSDIPYNIDNLFTYKKLMEFKTLKDIPKKEFYKEDEVMGESINSAIQNVFTINKQKRDFGGELTLSEIKRDRDREANKEAAIKREGLSKVKEIIKINKRREELCNLYSDKRYKNYESAEKKKERTEKIKKLSKELKDILKTFKTNLYFNSVICSLEELPKGLFQMLNEKLATEGNKSPANYVGRINELKFIARKVFKVDLKSLEN